MSRTLLKNKMFIFVSLLLLIIVNPAQACTYFVNATDGNDINSGTSPMLAWQSLSRINIAPGDTVCLKRGEVWHEELLISQSGTQSAPITFSAYGGSDINPKIIRSDPSGWWQSSIAIGGFEWFKNDEVVSNKPNFHWPWYEGSSAGTRIVLETEDVVRGFYAAKIERSDNASGPAVLRMKRGIAQDTEHYLRFYTKMEGNAALFIRIRDDRVGTDLYLQADGSWTPNASFIKTYANISNYEARSFTFKTDINSESIDVQFIVRQGLGSVWVDEVLLVEGNAEPDYGLWQTRVVARKVFGLQDGDRRVPTRDYPGINKPDPLTLLEGEALSSYDQFYYRRDDGQLGEIEIGTRMNAIRIMGQSNIIIENIDVYGAGIRDSSATFDGEQALIFIQPGSSHIIIRDLTASYASGNAVSAGIYRRTNNPTDILYERLVAYNNESTALYIRGSGTIQNSVIFNGSKEANDNGDQGGIGVQEGPIDVIGNKVFMIGRDNTKIDAAISICCNLKGRVEVRNNQVYDVYGPALQLAGEGLNHPHKIIGNTLRRFAKTSNTDSVSGKYAGIKLSNIPGTLVENNVISDASDNINATGISLYGNVQNVIIKQNVFHNNRSYDIRAVNKSNEVFSSQGLSINDNFYRRNDYNNAWNWLGITYSSLQDWQAGQQQDSRSILLRP